VFESWRGRCTDAPKARGTKKLNRRNLGALGLGQCTGGASPRTNANADGKPNPFSNSVAVVIAVQRVLRSGLA
jgi:hypothetical protein